MSHLEFVEGDTLLFDHMTYLLRRRTRSTSRTPSLLNSGLSASNFLAVQGMMETTNRSLRLYAQLTGVVPLGQ